MKAVQKTAGRFWQLVLARGGPSYLYLNLASYDLVYPGPLSRKGKEDMLKQESLRPGQCSNVSIQQDAFQLRLSSL